MTWLPCLLFPFIENPDGCVIFMPNMHVQRSASELLLLSCATNYNVIQTTEYGVVSLCSTDPQFECLFVALHVFFSVFCNTFYPCSTGIYNVINGVGHFLPLFFLLQDQKEMHLWSLRPKLIKGICSFIWYVVAKQQALSWTVTNSMNAGNISD